MADVFELRMVEADADEVVSLLQSPVEWMEEAVAEAGRFGKAVDVRLRAELDLGPIRTPVGKRARLEVGPPKRVRGHFAVPITWQAEGQAGLFPVMDGMIEVHRGPQERSRLVFWGRYDPPLGRAGALVDRYVAHEVAQATVAHLLDSFAASLDNLRQSESLEESRRG